jgi:hypothetical protein
MTAEDVIVYSRQRLCQWVAFTGFLFTVLVLEVGRREAEYVGGKPRKNIGGRLDGALS